MDGWFIPPKIKKSDVIGKYENGWSNRPVHFFDVRNKNTNCSSKILEDYAIAWSQYLEGNLNFKEIESNFGTCLNINSDIFGSNMETVLKIMKYSQLGGSKRYYVSYFKIGS